MPRGIPGVSVAWDSNIIYIYRLVMIWDMCRSCYWRSKGEHWRWQGICEVQWNKHKKVINYVTQKTVHYILYVLRKLYILNWSICTMPCRLQWPYNYADCTSVMNVLCSHKEFAELFVFFHSQWIVWNQSIVIIICPTCTIIYKHILKMLANDIPVYIVNPWLYMLSKNTIPLRGSLTNSV